MTIKEQAVSDAMIEKVWADFVNCQDDRYFGNKTKRGHQLAVLRRFADSILASHPLEQQQAVSGDVVEAANRILSELDTSTRVGRFSRVEESDVEIVCRAALTASGVGRMREALEPFATLADSEIAEQFTDGTVWILTNGERRYGAISMGDLRKARTALQEDGRDD